MNIDGCENIWLKICDANIVIGTIYQHPKNDIQVFLNSLDKNLEQLNNTRFFL